MQCTAASIFADWLSALTAGHPLRWLIVAEVDKGLRWVNEWAAPTPTSIENLPYSRERIDALPTDTGWPSDGRAGDIITPALAAIAVSS